MSVQGKGLLGQGPTKGALYLLIGSVGLSIVYLLTGEDTRGQIAAVTAASGQSVWLEFRLWQIVTSPLLETRFVAVIFQGFMLWMFLPTLERWWGTKRFLLFALYTSIAGVVIGTLVGVTLSGVHRSYPITGLDPFIFSAILAYGILFKNQEVRFFGVLPMTGKQLTIGICVFMGILIALEQQWAQGAAYVGAMGTAWLLTNGKWTPKLWYLKQKQRRIRSKLRVVRDEDNPKRWLN